MLQSDKNGPENTKKTNLGLGLLLILSEIIFKFMPGLVNRCR